MHDQSPSNLDPSKSHHHTTILNLTCIPLLCYILRIKLRLLWQVLSDGVSFGSSIGHPGQLAGDKYESSYDPQHLCQKLIRLWQNFNKLKHLPYLLV
ncbi:hypothetical protein PGTUg99_024653 [Puccinia graminis f. sp. tritici]|uniref:Uncharacterized protein n=1 Tax=Puccinia graminis f. sp. tritici TaxID=56615 RepID=A0A5B0RMG2_PUCGR|nr:hypothetical protein PGTUg99_024653 [Puccinia graminis f. sp. tritici]